MKRMAVGIVGTGSMAATMMAAFARLPGVAIAGVASTSGAIDRARGLATAFGSDKAYGDTGPLFERGDIDLIYVASETRSHARVSVAALDAGKSVLCEKPFATSLAEARQVVDAARRNKKLFVEGLWTLLLPAYGRAGDIIAAKGFGRPTHLNASFGYPRTDDGSLAASGGVLLDRGVYPISLAIKLLGPVERVGAEIVDRAGTDVDANLQLVHRSGGQAQLAASFTALLPNMAVISGTGGSVTLEPPLLGSERLTIRVANAEGSGRAPPSGKPTPKDMLRAIPALRRLNRRLGEKRESHTFGANQYLPLVRHVVDLVASGKRESDIVPMELSLETARVIELARISSATRVAVEPRA